MTGPFLLVQLSDPHIGATWAGGDPVAGLRAAVESVRRLPDRPDAILMSGDMADNAADGEYELVRDLLAEIGVPVFVLPGNHDDRDRLRAHFDLPGARDRGVGRDRPAGRRSTCLRRGCPPSPARAANRCRSHPPGDDGRARRPCGCRGPQHVRTRAPQLQLRRARDRARAARLRRAPLLDGELASHVQAVI